jgi:hypothetical protein
MGKVLADTPTRKPILIYGGDESHERGACHLVAWRDIRAIT